MRLRRLRWLLGMCVAMFIANNVAAAVRACTVEFAGKEHAAIQALDSQGQEHVCPETDDATRCLAHCTQSAKSPEQNLSSDAPALAVPSIGVFLVSSRPEPTAFIAASAPPVVGPSLTILYRKLRN